MNGYSDSRSSVGVIGAGIQGVCISLCLIKKGFKVTLIDRDDPGKESASYGNAGHFSPYASVPSTHNQIKDLPSNQPNEKGYEYHNDYHRVNVGDGQCLFWPSYLLHGYQENRTPNRLSLSFNLFPTQVNRMYKL